MALIAREWFGDKGIDELKTEFLGMHAATNRDDIGIVMFAGKLGSIDTPDQRCANAINFIRSDLFAVAGATENNSEGARVVCHTLCCWNSEDRVIIEWIKGVWAVVDDFVASLF